LIRSKPTNPVFRREWDRIFRKEHDERHTQETLDAREDDPQNGQQQNHDDVLLRVP